MGGGGGDSLFSTGEGAPYCSGWGKGDSLFSGTGGARFLGGRGGPRCSQQEEEGLRGSWGGKGGSSLPGVGGGRVGKGFAIVLRTEDGGFHCPGWGMEPHCSPGGGGCTAGRGTTHPFRGEGSLFSMGRGGTRCPQGRRGVPCCSRGWRGGTKRGSSIVLCGEKGGSRLGCGDGEGGGSWLLAGGATGGSRLPSAGGSPLTPRRAAPRCARRCPRRCRGRSAPRGGDTRRTPPPPHTHTHTPPPGPQRTGEPRGAPRSARPRRDPPHRPHPTPPPPCGSRPGVPGTHRRAARRGGGAGRAAATGRAAAAAAWPAPVPVGARGGGAHRHVRGSPEQV